MSDNLQKYLPEYDEPAEREKLVHFSRKELLDLLIDAYKLKRVLAKMLGEEIDRKEKFRRVLDEPSRLLQMPDIPSDAELKKMLEE